MNPSGYLSNPDDRLLAEFLREVEAAEDQDTVVRRWCDDYPERATELLALARTVRLLGGSSPPSENPTPERLGDFQIVRQVASGGMGIIYEAVQEPFGRRVAVKTMRMAHLSEMACERFLREQAVLARLHHTSIVPIFAAGQLEGIHYFAMPYIHGVSLREIINDLRAVPPGTEAPALPECARRLRPSAGDLTPTSLLVSDDTPASPSPSSPCAAEVTEDYLRSVAEVIAEAAEAIGHAHERGVLHRDLKPANIMVDIDGRAWVLDFGLASCRGNSALPAGDEPDAITNQLSSPGTIMGTLDYLAPEQLRGESSERTDIWGLGSLLYEMLTFRRPFTLPREKEAEVYDSPSALKRRTRELHRPLAWSREALHALPRDLRAICGRCLEKRTEKRYASAQRLADDLRCYLRGEQTSARPWSPAERAWHWGQRYPAQASLVLMMGAFVLLLTLLAGHVGQLRRANALQAEKLARTADHQLRTIKQAVADAAQQPPLIQHLANFQGDPEPLHQFLLETREREHLNRFARPGDAQPFVNWFVLNLEGVILADSYDNPPHPVVGQCFAYRDYAHRLVSDHGSFPRNAVYVSEVFPSVQDDKYKFAVITRVWNGDRFLGQVAAAVAIDSQLVALDMRYELPHAQLVGPMDRRPRPGEQGEQTHLPKYVVVLDSAYEQPGTNPIAADRHEGILDIFATDPEFTDTSTTYLRGGRLWVADLVRVGDSSFVAIVEQPYPWEVTLLAWAALPVTVSALGLLVYRLARRYRRRRLSTL